jgi:hypothetical protein
VPSLPTIAATTPWNDEGVLSAVIAGLKERCTATVGGDGLKAGIDAVWLKIDLDPAFTISGTYDEETDSTTLICDDGAVHFYNSWPVNPLYPLDFPLPWVMQKIVVTGVGEFTIREAGHSDGHSYVVVNGDATCAAATYSVSPKGSVLGYYFWRVLQTTIEEGLTSQYLNTYSYRDPEGESPQVNAFFYHVPADFRAAAGLYVFPRRIRARGPCSLSYDAEADETTIADPGTPVAGSFSAGHVGKRLDIFGAGQFVITACLDENRVTVAGRVTHADTVVSVLPDSPFDLADAAFEEGCCNYGDVLGPWLLFDLVAAIRALEYTLIGISYTYGESGVEGRRAEEIQDNENHPDEPNEGRWPIVKTNAEAVYAAADPCNEGLRCLGQLDAGYINHYNRGTLIRGRAKFTWAVPESSAPLGYDIDLYGAADRPGGTEPELVATFDGHGDFPVEGVLHLCCSEADVEARSGVSTDWVGSLALPNWPPATPTYPDATPMRNGYEGTPWVGVVKWAFEYV